MTNDDFIQKSAGTISNAAHGVKRAVSDGAKKVDEARRSDKADHIREVATHGFERIMKAILPGKGHRPRLIEGSTDESYD